MQRLTGASRRWAQVARATRRSNARNRLTFRHEGAARPRNDTHSTEPRLCERRLGGFRHDDTVVVGARPEVLTRASKDLAAQTVA